MKLMLDEIDAPNSKKVLELMRQVRDEFMVAPIADIAINKNVKDLEKYCGSMSDYLANGMIYPKGCPPHVKAAMAYNYVIQKYKLQLQPISSGNKIRWVYTKKSEDTNAEVMGFIGAWPEVLNKMFEIDKDVQFEKNIPHKLEEFFDIYGWGKIILDENTVMNLVEY
jgi:hypothetical protein